MNIIDSTSLIRLQIFYTECENNKSVRRNQPAIVKHSPDPAIYKSSKLIFGQARRGGAGVLFLAGVGVSASCSAGSGGVRQPDVETRVIVNVLE